MKINKQSLRQIIKEELQNVLKEDWRDDLSSAKEKLRNNEISEDQYEKLKRAALNKRKSQQQPEDEDVLAGDTVAGGAPEQDELSGDTLAGKTIAQDTLAGKTTGFDEPQQDAQQMVTKYAKVKQILAKLVSEL